MMIANSGVVRLVRSKISGMRELVTIKAARTPVLAAAATPTARGEASRSFVMTVRRKMSPAAIPITNSGSRAIGLVET
jgi:hypothetical protein